MSVKDKDLLKGSTDFLCSSVCLSFKASSAAPWMTLKTDPAVFSRSVHTQTKLLLKRREKKANTVFY